MLALVGSQETCGVLHAETEGTGDVTHRTQDTANRCLRGTNALEGYHLHLRKFFGAVYASPELMHTLLQEFIFRWNTRAGIKNLGECDLGMFEHEIAEELYYLTQPYVGDGKLIHKTPLRSIDGAEYVPQEADDGRFFGLRPILQKLDNVAATTALDPCIDGEAGSAADDDGSGEDSDAMYSSDEEDSTADVFSTTAHSLSTRREHSRRGG